MYTKGRLEVKGLRKGAREGGLIPLCVCIIGVLGGLGGGSNRGDTEWIGVGLVDGV